MKEFLFIKKEKIFFIYNLKIKLKPNSPTYDFGIFKISCFFGILSLHMYEGTKSSLPTVAHAAIELPCDICPI